MSQKTVHSCIRQGNQCRIPLSFLEALVMSRIRNLFCNSAFSELPLWLSYRGAHRAPYPRSGLCCGAAARIQQRLLLRAQPWCGARLSLGCGAGVLRPSQCPGLQPCAAALSSTTRTRQRGCSRATHCCGTQSSLATGRRDKTGGCIKHQSTCYMENLFSNTFPEPLCIHSHSEQQHLVPSHPTDRPVSCHHCSVPCAITPCAL